ncbi:hypothetical protein VNO78_14167 [Psophocarpus tetragonolobus]|uniref:MLO-like protein n=1 Tax=Psophocarpus tetragonolobus TaxID=3891 RepID=A0AAN9SPY4_PSOTE
MGGRSLEETPTWAVAVVCFVLLSISMFIEHIIHFIGKSLISRICISENVARTFHPCTPKTYHSHHQNVIHAQRLLPVILSSDNQNHHRILAAGGGDKCPQGKVPFVSSEGIHQLHIFIFVLAVFHVLYCILTLALGRAKILNDSDLQEKHLLEDDTYDFGPKILPSFGLQFVRSVPKVDYLTLRHGFMMAHLGPQSHPKFDFRQYIKRSLEEDFKVVVEISTPIWFITVLFLLFHTHGWYSYLWLPFAPLIIVLLVGTKLQVIITKMGQRIQERGEVVKGMPLVQPGDDLFWFNKPRLVLYLINFVLFQNAFQLAYFSWTVLQFGIKSCFHSQTEDMVIKISMGVLVQFLCSYVTLPLYALVTQMGSMMKATIFSERVAVALRKWHHTARKHVKQNGGLQLKSTVSGPTTPNESMSKANLLRQCQSEINIYPIRSDSDAYEIGSPPHHHKTKVDASSSTSIHHHQMEMAQLCHDLPQNVYQPNSTFLDMPLTQH